jgi:epoxyqueuosine reductase
MSRTGELREDPKALEPWVRGLFCAAMPYNTSRALSAQSIASGRAWVSRYAWGRDYHKVLRSRLLPAARFLEAKGFKARICVDSAPLLERAYAVKAGLGFIGKNGCLVHPERGSYLFLGEILTDLDLPDGEPIPDGCGDCALCLRGCPTRAFAAPRILDARRCLSTWTIEHRGPFPESTPPLHGHLFGCDRCQEVCPYNRRAPLSGEADFRPRPPWLAPDPLSVACMDQEQWEESTQSMALRRARYDGLMRNARRIRDENAARRTSG